MNANGLNGISVLGRQRKNCSIRDAKGQNQDWLAAQIARRPVQAVVDDTGMSEKAVQNIRQRKGKLSFDNLVELCRNDPEFRAAFFAHCGGMLEGEPEMVAALSKAINAVMQQRRGG